MNYIQAIVLGVIQGLTEFLPISSSGHLVLVPALLGWEIDPLSAFVFDVLVQWGTTFAVVIYFWKDIRNIVTSAISALISRKPLADRKAYLAWLILLASVPAALVGLILKDLVTDTFSSPIFVSAALLMTAALMAWGERVATRRKRIFAIEWLDAFWIGVFQILALFPGISRSGATISGGLWRGLRRPAAARFSFLMSLPVMLGAGLIAIQDLFQIPDAVGQIGPILVGTISAAIVGMLAIHWLLGYLARNSLRVFIFYCLIVGAGGLIYYAALR